MKMMLDEILEIAAHHRADATSRKPVVQLASAASGLQWTSLKCGWIIGIFSLLLATVPVQATTWYVDNAATGSNNGTSWANAFTSLGSANPAPGDTVYISGGTTSRTYVVNSWSPAGGSVGNPVTWQTGQDSGHNGMVILDGQNNSFPIRDIGQNCILSGQVGSDGLQHMEIINVGNFAVYQTSAQSNNIRICYIKIPSSVGMFRFDNQIQQGTGIEIDHCWTHKISPPASNGGLPDDTFYFGGGGGPAFDTIKVHDNYCETPCNASEPAFGDDWFKWGTGFSVYNNHVKIYLDSNYPYGAQYQHSDLFQTSGSYVKIYNNFFENVGESAFFFDPFGSGHSTFTAIYYYNNIVWQNPAQLLSGVARGLDFQLQDDGLSTVQNVIIANNDFINLNHLFTLRFDNAAAWVNCHFVNNCCVNGYSIALTGPAQTEAIIDHNFQDTNPPPVFANPAPDFHLASTDTQCRNQGSNFPSAYFTTDKDGNTRPTSSAWDIGAYQFAGRTTNRPAPPGNLRVVPR